VTSVAGDCHVQCHVTAPKFDSQGFANAEIHYAGSDGTPSLNSNNDHAVSQYDIACVLFTAAHS
jgi:hypothetical protein